MASFSCGGRKVSGSFIPYYLRGEKGLSERLTRGL